MNKKIILSAILVVSLTISLACSASSRQDNLPTTLAAPSPASSPKSESVVLDTNRLVVRSAKISVEVSDVTQTRDKVAGLAVKYNGYVVSSDFRGRDQSLNGTITIRVAADKYDEAMAEIRALGIRVVSEQSSTQDVTAQYIDLKARLTNAQATEAQYLTLLTRAQQISDIMLVQDKLSQVRQTIEQLQGQIGYLENTSATSLIAVTIMPDGSSQPVVEGDWSFTDHVKSAAHGFIEFGKVFLTVLIWVGIFVPVWGTVLGVRYWRRKKKRTQAPPPPAPPPAAPAEPTP